MKRISIVSFAAILFFAACTNDGSSSVGTYETEESSSSTEENEHGAGGHEGVNAESGHMATGDTTAIMNHNVDSLER